MRQRSSIPIRSCRQLLVFLSLLAAACGSAKGGPPGPGGGSGSGGSAPGGGGAGGAGGDGAGGVGGDGPGGSGGRGGAAVPDGASADDAATPSPADGGPVVGQASEGGVATGPGDAAAAPPDSAPLTTSFQVDGVATWLGNARAAYSIIHDDVCDPSANGVFAHADPELFKRGLHAGFGVIAGTCVSEKKWDNVKTLVSHGHDVFNHSWTHNCLSNRADCAGNGTPSSDFALEIDQAGKFIQDNTGVTARYYIFPFDVFGAGAVAHLQQAGYLG